jgi:hypothetical protein
MIARCAPKATGSAATPFALQSTGYTSPTGCRGLRIDTPATTTVVIVMIIPGKTAVADLFEMLSTASMLPEAPMF